MKKTGFVDEHDIFCFEITYRTKSSWDMVQMQKTLNEYGEDAFVASYDDDEVRVIVRPDW